MEDFRWNKSSGKVVLSFRFSQVSSFKSVKTIFQASSHSFYILRPGVYRKDLSSVPTNRIILRSEGLDLGISGFVSNKGNRASHGSEGNMYFILQVKIYFWHISNIFCKVLEHTTFHLTLTQQHLSTSNTWNLFPGLGLQAAQGMGCPYNSFLGSCYCILISSHHLSYQLELVQVKATTGLSESQCLVCPAGNVHFNFPLCVALGTLPEKGIGLLFPEPLSPRMLVPSALAGTAPLREGKAFVPRK